MLITNFTTRRILIDNDSSGDLLFWDVFTQMGIDLDHLYSAPMPLKGFTWNVVQLVGAITLSFLVKKAPTKTDFLVVTSLSLYNMIKGQPMLNNLKAITSTYHLNMKFPTKARVGKIKGEQVLAQECYVQELKTKGKYMWTLGEQTCNIGPPPAPNLADSDEDIRAK